MTPTNSRFFNFSNVAQCGHHHFSGSQSSFLLFCILWWNLHILPLFYLLLMILEKGKKISGKLLAIVSILMKMIPCWNHIFIVYMLTLGHVVSALSKMNFSSKTVMKHTSNNDFTMHVFHSLFSLSCYVMDFQEHTP